MAGLNLLIKGGPLSREESLFVSLLAFSVGLATFSAMGAAMIQSKSSSGSILRLPGAGAKGEDVPRRSAGASTVGPRIHA